MLENKEKKILKSERYNYIFDKNSGFFARWGKTIKDDPNDSPYGPEIADIEITTICDGIGNKGPCKFCYKSNTQKGVYMSFETYKKLFHKLPNTVTQIAFGADAKCKSNPDTFKIMEYTRENGVIPNITVADLDDETAKKLANVCGAVAVSYYNDKEICYGTIQKLHKYGLKQINIHSMISIETLDQTYDLFNDFYKNHSGLNGLNAIVLLSLKTKGRGKGFHPISQKQFDSLVNYGMNHNIPLGFDSCSAPKLMKTIQNNPNKEEIEKSIEPCESTCFSIYADVNGNFYPCSFCENIDGWKDGIALQNINNFNKDVWQNEKIVKFRQKLLNGNRNCPVYSV